MAYEFAKVEREGEQDDVDLSLAYQEKGPLVP